MLPANLIWLNLATALGIGLLIGTERERHKGRGPSRAPAGIRSFAIVSLLGFAYWRSTDDDPGLTTETAVLLTLILGALATRSPGLAAGLAVAVAALLTSRQWLHRFVRSVLTEDEFDDLMVLAAATLVVLLRRHAFGGSLDRLARRRAAARRRRRGGADPDCVDDQHDFQGGDRRDERRPVLCAARGPRARLRRRRGVVRVVGALSGPLV